MVNDRQSSAHSQDVKKYKQDMFYTIIEMYLADRYNMKLADRKLLGYLRLGIPEIDVICDKRYDLSEMPKRDKELMVKRFKSKTTRKILETIFDEKEMRDLENLVKTLNNYIF